MINSGVLPVRLEMSDFPYRRMIALLITIFILFCIIGGTGPTVFHKDSYEDIQLTFDSSGQTSISQIFGDFEELNRLLWVNFKLFRQDTAFLSESITTTLDVIATGTLRSADNSIHLINDVTNTRHVTFPAGSVNSQHIFLYDLDTIAYSTYNTTFSFMKPTGLVEPLTASVHVHYVNAAYTSFEMGFKYTFFVITLLILFAPNGYISQLNNIPVKNWSKEQYWILVLLEVLLLFNDPFIAGEVFSDSAKGLRLLYILFQITFISLLFTFWISVVDDARQTQRRGFGSSRDSSMDGEISFTSLLCRYGPRVICMGTLYILMLIVFMQISMRTEGDPTYNGFNDNSLHPEEIALITFLSLYIIYLFLLLIRSMMRFSEMTSPYKFIVVLTIVVIVLSFAALLSGFYTAFQSPLIFLVFHGLMNIYIWTIAFCFLPVTQDEMHRLHNLSDFQRAGYGDDSDYMTTAGLITLSSESSSQPSTEEDEEIEVELGNSTKPPVSIPL